MRFLLNKSKHKCSINVKILISFFPFKFFPFASKIPIKSSSFIFVYSYDFSMISFIGFSISSILLIRENIINCKFPYTEVNE